MQEGQGLGFIYFSIEMSWGMWFLHTAVLDGKQEDVASTDGLQIVHGLGNVVLENHGADGDPFWVLERRDRGSLTTRSDDGCLLEVLALDVVVDVDVLLGGDDSLYPSSNGLNQVGVRWLFGCDEHSL